MISLRGVPIRRKAARTRTPTSPAGDEGYTLVEVVVVLAIIGLLLSLAPVAYEAAVPAARVNAAARELATDLRRLRAVARTEGKAMSLAISEDGRAYEAADLALTRNLGRSLNLAYHPVDGGDTSGFADAFTFYPQGGSSGGAFVIDSGDRQATVRVHWLTARIEVE